MSYVEHENPWFWGASPLSWKSKTIGAEAGMNHARILRTVLGVTAAYLVLLGLWLGWVVQHTPPGTAPYQVMVLVGLFGSCVGIGMLVAGRPTKEDRRLHRHGVEGWARIAGVRALERTGRTTQLTELELEITVPGSESYCGTIVIEVSVAERSLLTVGETLSIRVDPDNRDRIILDY